MISIVIAILILAITVLAGCIHVADQTRKLLPCIVVIHGGGWSAGGRLIEGIAVVRGCICRRGCGRHDAG